MSQLINLIPVAALISGIPGIFAADAIFNNKERSSGSEDIWDETDDEEQDA